MKFHLGIFTAAFGMGLGVTASASFLFSDDFDTDTSASWNVNKANNVANNVATFNADYSVYGIPSAPGSTGGSTRGLILEANIAGGIFGGLSVSPQNVSIVGDFKITADVWLNYVGPGPAGGSGTTQLAGLGWGTAGTTPQWAGAVQDSAWFGTTIDGGSAADYRLYSPVAQSSYASGNAVYASPGGALNNSNAYYTTAFPSVSLPGTQNGFTTQTGTTAAGTTGFAWRKWTVERVGNNISYFIDTTRIATVDATTFTAGGSNLAIVFSDTNAGSTTSTSRLNFMLVDNIQVVPEPTSMVALSLGILAIAKRRKK